LLCNLEIPAGVFEVKKVKIISNPSHPVGRSEFGLSTSGSKESENSI
jgi:hypothetical protein